MRNAFITGTSSGLGHGLADRLSQQGWRVHGCSRRGCDLPEVRDQVCDLSDYEHLPTALEVLLGEIDTLDLAVLNVGSVGTRSPSQSSSRASLRSVSRCCGMIWYSSSCSSTTGATARRAACRP